MARKPAFSTADPNVRLAPDGKPIPGGSGAPDPRGIGSSQDTSASGIGGTISKFMGGQSKFRANRSGYGPEEAQRIEVDRARQIESRDQGAEFTQYLRDAAQGRTGPSVAERQLAQSTAAAQGSAAGMAASARGPNRALAQRAAIGEQGRLQAAANAQGATLRAQEQMSREQMVADMMQKQRLADLQSQGLSLDEANAKLQAEMQAQQINSQIALQNAQAAGSAGGGLLSAAGGLLAMSDERGKRDMTPLEPLPQTTQQKSSDNSQAIGAILGGLSAMSDRRAKELTDENTVLRRALRSAVSAGAIDAGARAAAEPPSVDLRAAPGFRYEYRDPGAPGAAPGEQVGPTAQDLERTAARGAVVDTPRGKMVNGARLALVNTAALSEEQRRSQEQDARIGRLEESLRAAASGRPANDNRMELGFDRNAGVAGLYREQGSVIGEGPTDPAYRAPSGHMGLIYDPDARIYRPDESGFGVGPSRFDQDALDEASRRQGIEPVKPKRRAR